MDAYGAIFDMDGVLVDSYRAHLESWRRMSAKFGLEMSERQFAETFGRTTRDIIDRLWGDDFPDIDVEAWDADKEAAYREILAAGFPAMNGAGDLLAALGEAGFRIAIGSSGPPENVALVRAKLPGAEHVSQAVNGKEVAEGKPHPEVFLKAAEKLGLPPQRCAVVEDAPAGIEAARRAKMAAVGLTGTADRATLAAGAHLVVDKLSELTPAGLARLIDAVAEGSAGGA